MKNFFEKLRQNYGKNKIELVLLCLFFAAAFVLNRKEIAHEAALFGESVEAFGAHLTGTVEDTENEMETGSESETGAEMETGSEAGAELETGDGTETEPETEDGTEAGPQTELQKEYETERFMETELMEAPMMYLELTAPYASEETAKWSAYQETVFEYETPFAPVRSGQYDLLPDRMLLRDLSDTLEPFGYERVERMPFFVLKRMIEKEIETYDGDWSVYVKNLSTDRSFVVNDVPMKSASVMKLFIMGTVYKAFETGELERSEQTVSLLKDMITYSGNDSSNSLLYLLGDSDYQRGIAKVDTFIEEYGFSDMTVEYNGFNDSDTMFHEGMFNQVAAKDCGKLLEDIYRRTWVNREVGNEMETMLLNQHTRYKIPSGLPEGVLCGNKSGEMDTTENDAAIVYGPDCDYILVVLSSDWGSKSEAIDRIRALSEMVYAYLND